MVTIDFFRVPFRQKFLPVCYVFLLFTHLSKYFFFIGFAISGVHTYPLLRRLAAYNRINASLVVRWRALFVSFFCLLLV